ncbi:MAG: hypothetical protein J0H07_05105 [Sphingobacteriales bacterium]|nr:hypothetical protein [Sphingobacteriales bacterium]
MKRSLFNVPSMAALVLFVLAFISCKKNDLPAKSEKYKMVTGTWKQSDIVLGVPVSVKVGGTKYSFPSGTSVITDPYLKAFGVAALFAPTKGNIYNFTDSGSYRIDGVTNLILPVAGSNGSWTLDVYDAVLKLTSPAKVDDPHWIAGIASDSLALSMIVNIPGLGTAPLTLILKRS